MEKGKKKLKKNAETLIQGRRRQKPFFLDQEWTITLEEDGYEHHQRRKMEKEMML